MKRPCGATITTIERQSTMFCSNCGKKTEEDAKFCKSCGTPMPDVGGLAPGSVDTLGSAAGSPLDSREGIGQVDGPDHTERELQRQIAEQQERIQFIRSQMALERRIRNSQREIRRLEEEELREQEQLERLRLSGEEEAWSYEYGTRDFLSSQPSKSKVAAGIFALLLGTLGIHKFYMGYVGVGIIYIILSITLYGLFFTVPASIVDGILYLTKTDEDFERTYIYGRRRWF